MNLSPKVNQSLISLSRDGNGLEGETFPRGGAFPDHLCAHLGKLSIPSLYEGTHFVEITPFGQLYISAGKQGCREEHAWLPMSWENEVRFRFR